LLFILGPGCFVDMAVNPAGDSASSSTGTDTGGQAGNLLANGSFDNWNVDRPQAWTRLDVVSITKIEDDVADGTAAAQIESSDFSSVGQIIQGPFAAGTCFEGTGAVRWDAGDPAAPSILLIDDDWAVVMGADLHWVDDGTWYTSDVGLMLDHDSEWLEVDIASNDPGTQTFSVDAVSLREIPCG
jgi:hypothetical protein